MSDFSKYIIYTKTQYSQQPNEVSTEVSCDPHFSDKETAQE